MEKAIKKHEKAIRILRAMMEMQSRIDNRQKQLETKRPKFPDLVPEMKQDIARWSLAIGRMMQEYEYVINSLKYEP